MAAMRDAASSMPSGRPSRFVQISVTAFAVSTSRRPKSGRTARARSTNRVTAWEIGPPSNVRGTTANGTSPSTASGSRDVATTVTAPARPRIMATADPAAARTCSQLSTTRRSRRPRNASATVSMSAAPLWGVMPSTVAMAAGTDAGSAIDASSTSHTPSTNSPATSAPTSSASRVLPTPPTPVSVTSRCERVRSATSATVCSRPMSELNCCGRFPAKGSTLRSSGNAVARPSATIWCTEIRPRCPRRRCSPRGRSGTRSRSITSVASDTRTCPPCASDVSRAARFTSLP